MKNTHKKKLSLAFASGYIIIDNKTKVMLETNLYNCFFRLQKKFKNSIERRTQTTFKAEFILKSNGVYNCTTTEESSIHRAKKDNLDKINCSSFVGEKFEGKIKAKIIALYGGYYTQKN